MTQEEINAAAHEASREAFDNGTESEDIFKAGVEFAKSKLYTGEAMKEAFLAGRRGYMRGSMVHKEYYFSHTNFDSWFRLYKK